MSEKILVVGGGPAGMSAAIAAACCGADVTLLEKNKDLGKKLLITGKGRCNITNFCSKEEFITNVTHNGKFLYSAINAFSCQDTVDFFENLGVKTKVERGNRVFPVSDKASDVRDAMKGYVEQLGCTMKKCNVQRLIIEHGRIGGIVTSDEEKIDADAVIIATGGKSYPRTGSTGDGYRLARQAGHTVVPTKPSLVPLVCKDSQCGQMQGLSLKNVGICVNDTKTNQVVYKDFGEMLFTHFGLSGPIILSASAHMKDMERGRYAVSIDLKPALSFEQLDSRFLREFESSLNKDVANIFSNLLPKKMIPVVMSRWGVQEHIKCNCVTKEQRTALVNLLKNFDFEISGFRPIEEAIVTSGGVSVREIDPKTMQSRIIHGLFFAGEVIDVDAYTGGFNLQIAFSTGISAGRSSAVFK